MDAELMKKIATDTSLEHLTLTMTPERKARMLKACMAIVDVLHKETESLLESYAVIEKLLESLKEYCGIKAVLEVKQGEHDA
jgi:hypothetical protein